MDGVRAEGFSEQPPAGNEYSKDCASENEVLGDAVPSDFRCKSFLERASWEIDAHALDGNRGIGRGEFLLSLR